MATEDEVRAGRAELDETIRRLAPILDLADPGDLIGEWVIIGQTIKADTDDVTQYWHAFSGGSQAPHVTLGLIGMLQASIYRSEPE